jgi:heme exporter protein C
VTRFDAPAVHVDILWPLLIAGLGFLFAFAAIVLLRMRTTILERRARALMLARAAEARAPEAVPA